MQVKVAMHFCWSSRHCGIGSFLRDRISSLWIFTCPHVNSPLKWLLFVASFNAVACGIISSECWLRGVIKSSVVNAIPSNPPNLFAVTWWRVLDSVLGSVCLPNWRSFLKNPVFAQHIKIKTCFCSNIKSDRSIRALGTSGVYKWHVLRALRNRTNIEYSSIGQVHWIILPRHFEYYRREVIT